MADGFLVHEDDHEALHGAVEMFRTYGGQVRENLGRQSQDMPSGQPRWPIRGVLTQDVGGGMSGQVAVLTRANYQMQWKLDLYGALTTANIPFKLVCNGIILSADGATIASTTLLGTTAVLNTSPTSAIQMQAALVNAGICNQSEILIGLGSVFSDGGQVLNSLLTLRNSDGSYYSTPRTWLISITRQAYADKYHYLDLVPYDSTGTTMFANFNNLLIARRTQDVWTGSFEIVTDVMGFSDITPLRAGSIVTAMDFPDVGYGIVSAYQRDFDLTSDSV